MKIFPACKGLRNIWKQFNFTITKERFSVDTVRKMCFEDLRTVCDWPDLSMFTCPEMCMLCDWPDLAMFIFLGYQLLLSLL